MFISCRERFSPHGAHEKARADDSDTAVVFVSFASAIFAAALFADADVAATAIFATAIFVVHGAQYIRAAALARS
jgi:hypothetical protein